ncbi:AI-2E family transporter [Georgenia sp. Z1344]|uniref:AI-2E family transporter n=1 Tax=Georgenia sp. Z1344 TaxID=3416706 RepID=UPI003CF52EBE
MARLRRSIRSALGSTTRRATAAVAAAARPARREPDDGPGETARPGESLRAEEGRLLSRTGAGLVPGDVDAGAAGADDELRAAPDRTVPWTMRAIASWSWRIVVITLAAAIIGWLLVQLRTIVVSLMVAMLLSVLLAPLASFLRRRARFPRAIAALASLVVLVAVVAGLLVLAGQSIASGFQRLADQALLGIDQLVSWLGTGPLGLDQADIDTAMEQGTQAISQNSETLATGVLTVTSSVAEIFAGFFIAIFCTFFFLSDGRSLWGWVVRLTPARARPTIHEAGIRAWYTVSGYTRGQIVVAFVDAVGIGLAAALLGVPLALPIAILVFLGAFIPIIGALISGTVAVLVAVVDSGIYIALAMLGAVLFVQFIESHVLQPMIQSRAVQLHPIAVLLAVAGGTAVAGLVGALFAVPVVAVVNSVGLYLAGRDPQPHLAKDLHRTGGPPPTVLEYAPTADEPDEEPFADVFAEEHVARPDAPTVGRDPSDRPGGAR